MLVEILDGEGAPRTVVWQGQDTIINRSGKLAVGAVGAVPVPQLICDASDKRAGFLFQNNSQAAMLLYESGITVDDSPWLIAPGAYFPPFPGYPIPTGKLYVSGVPNISQENDTFTCKEWVGKPVVPCP